MDLYSNKEIKKAFKSYLINEITRRNREQNSPLVLAVYLIGDDPASVTYVAMKQRMALQLGIEVLVRKFSVDQFNETKHQLRIDSDDIQINGIIIQLPLPTSSDSWYELLSLIPTHKDVDVLNPDNYTEHAIIQPTVQAILLVLNDIIEPDLNLPDKLSKTKAFGGKQVVVIGRGKLVGKPVLRLLDSLGIEAIVIDKDTPSPRELALQGDIVICGAGSPKLVTSSWLKENTIAIDASTSNDNGQLIGDIDISQDVSQNFLNSVTIVPSPGGIGPLTVLSLFHNLLTIADNR